MIPTMSKDFNVKITIMYIINKFKEPVNDEIITDMCVNLCDINYFSLKQCEYELIESEFLYLYNNDGNEFYDLTDKGHQAIEFFATKLPYSFRVEINEYIQNYTPDIYAKSNFVCDYFPANDIEYNVKFTFSEGDSPILEMMLRSGDKEQAKQITRVIKKNKEKIYTDLYRYIMHLTTAEEKIDTPKFEDIDDITFFN